MDIQERTASEMKRAALEMGKTTAQATRYIAEATINANKLLINLLRAVAQKGKTDIINGETTLDQLERCIEKGDFLTSVTISDEDVEFYKAEMQKENMAYVVLDMNNDDCKTIIYLNSDAERLKNVISLHHAKAGIMNEIAPEVFLNHIENKNIGVIRSLNDTEFELFREAAQEKNLIYSFYRKNNRITVLYDLKDKDNVNDALKIVSWNMTHKYSDYIVNRVILKRNARQNLADAIKGQKVFYAVNAKDVSNYLTITAEGLSYYKNNNKVLKISRSDKYFADKVREKFKGLQNHVVLSDSVFKQTVEKRELHARDLYDEYPDYVAEAIKKSNERLNNVIAKMSLDDENENPAQIFDDGVSYSNYAIYEDLSDTDRKELEEHIEKFIEHRHSIVNKEIPVKDRNLDNIIREAERNKTVSEPKSNQFENMWHNRKVEEIDI